MGGRRRSRTAPRPKISARTRRNVQLKVVARQFDARTRRGDGVVATARKAEKRPALPAASFPAPGVALLMDGSATADQDASAGPIAAASITACQGFSCTEIVGGAGRRHVVLSTSAASASCRRTLASRRRSWMRSPVRRPSRQP